jgi:hypothetical protein
MNALRKYSNIVGHSSEDTDITQERRRDLKGGELQGNRRFIAERDQKEEAS